MIFIKADLGIGKSHEEWATEALALAKRLGVGLEVEPNRIVMRVLPDDTVPRIIERYHRHCAQAERFE